MAFRNIALISLTVLTLGTVGQSLAQEPGLLLTNGNILTLDDDNTVVNSVFVRLGRIAEVGNDLEAPVGATVIDLEGRTMIPGLMDSHAHFLRHGQRPGHDVRGVEVARTMAEFTGAMAERAAGLPDGELVTVITGWNPIQLAENRMPTMAELDAALPNHPAYVHYAAYGPAVTNSLGKAMFEAGGLTVGDDGFFEERDEAVASYYFLRGKADDPAEGARHEGSHGLSEQPRHDVRHRWGRHALRRRPDIRVGIRLRSGVGALAGRRHDDARTDYVHDLG